MEVVRLSYALNDSAASGEVNYQVVGVNLGTRSSYDQVVNFLSSVENASRVIKVNNVRFSEDTDGEYIASTFILVSPYADLQTAASVDTPIEFDITDTRFQELMNSVRGLRHYEISVDSFIPVPVETTPEELVETTEEISTEEVTPVEEVVPEEVPVEVPAPAVEEVATPASPVQ
jgi:hypothetical protein